MPTKKKRANQPSDDVQEMDLDQTKPAESSDSSDDSDDDDGMPDAVDGNEVSSSSADS